MRVRPVRRRKAGEGATSEGEAARAVHQSVDDGVSNHGVPSSRASARWRLTGNHRGPSSGPILDQSQEITVFPVPEWREVPVIEDQQIRLAIVCNHPA